MSMFIKRAARIARRAGIFAASVGLIALAAPASAATLGLVGGTLLPDGSSAITAADKRDNPSYGLTLDSKAYVTFTFVSGTSGAPYRPNQLVQNTNGWDLVFRSDKTAPDSTSASILMGPGLLPFKMKIRATREIFTNHNPYTTIGNVAVAFSEIFNNGKSIIASFDDGLGGERAYDDLVARIDIASIPLPAGGLLLLGGLGGLGLVARRRSATA